MVINGLEINVRCGYTMVVEIDVGIFGLVGLVCSGIQVWWRSLFSRLWSLWSRLLFGWL